MTGIRRVFTITLVGLLMMTSMAHARTHKSIQPSLKVITYNVNWRDGLWGKKSPEETMQLLERVQADMIFLQEFSVSWEDILHNGRLAQYPYRLIKARSDEGGYAVLSRYPFEMTSYFRPNPSWFPTMLLMADTPLGKLQIVHAHLTPPLVARDAVGMFGSGVRYTKTPRFNETTQILAKLDPHFPTFMLGDFNEELHGKSMQLILQQGFKSAISYIPRKQTTWHWRVGPITLKRQYDHIFAQAPLHVQEGHIIREGSSDHFPVIATLTIAD